MDCARILIQAGAKSSVEDRWGQTPVSEAERAGHLQLKEFLDSAAP